MTKNPSLIEDIAQASLSVLPAYGLSETEAQEVAVKVAAELSLKIGGGQVYVPQTKAVERQIRNEKIVIEFNGRNVAELSKKHGCHRSVIYRVLQQKRNNKNGASGKNR